VDSEPQTYAAAGVSIEKGDAVVARIRAAVESTGAMGFGAFAGLHPLDEGRLRGRGARAGQHGQRRAEAQAGTQPIRRMHP